MIDITKVSNVRIEGIDTKDYPDFVDAYLVSGWYRQDEGTDLQMTRYLTNHETEYINTHHTDKVQEWAMEQIQ